MLVLFALLGHLKLCHRVLEPRNSSPEPPVFGLQRYQRILHRGDAAGLQGDLPRRKQVFLHLPAHANKTQSCACQVRATHAGRGEKGKIIQTDTQRQVRRTIDLPGRLTGDWPGAGAPPGVCSLSLPLCMPPPPLLNASFSLLASGEDLELLA